MLLSNYFASVYRYAGAVLFILLLNAALHAQITPSADAYIDTTKPTTNYGSAVTLGVVSPSQTTYITFDLSSIPSGYTGSNIAKASLKLYVNTLPKAGSFNVDYVNGSWSEATIDANNAPPPGATIAASIPLTKSQVLDYVVIDITSAVEAWLNGTEPNYGLALVANSPLSTTFDSKENKTQSHPPELDIVFTGGGGGGGTITGVLTGAGSGLTGGGTSGTLNLSLLTSCGSGQVLEWSGSAWACASLSGGGTITGVIAGTDLTGGGYSGNVTLNLDITKVPQLATANTFTGNQTVNGNLSATGAVSGSSYQIGSNLFAFGSYANTNAFLGFAGNTTTTGLSNTATGYGALSSNTTGNVNTATGYEALFSNTTGISNTANGSSALSFNTTGSNNAATGSSALFQNTTGSGNTATGYSALIANTTGNYNTANGSYALSSNSTGGNNTANGSYALFTNTTGGSNTANGYYALISNYTGSYNTAEGVSALFSNQTGNTNTASGYQALYQNTAGSENTAFGDHALFWTTGSYNTSSGRLSLFSNQTGTYNTASGHSALYNNKTGSYNTALGYNAGSDSASTNLTNSTAIGANAVVSESNALVLGGTGSNAVKVGIGTATPAYTLDVQGSGRFSQPITFASGQTFPGSGTVTSVGSGAGLTGGPITSSGTLSIATGGVINAMLANPSLTINPGTDLTGGGTVALGGSTTLYLDTTKVPQLASANTFSGSQTINNNVIITGAGTALTASGTGSNSTGVSGTGTYYGLHGIGNSSNAEGVFGESNSGTNAIGVAGTSSTGIGVYGSGPTGVYGYDPVSGGAGVSGLGTTGVSGTGIGSASSGVYGVGSAYGVEGIGNVSGSIGVAGYGSGSGSAGVYGSGDYGVYGMGSSYGTYGISTSGTGVYGSGNNYGVYGTGTGGNTSYGVYGSGTLAGVSGTGPIGTNGVGTGANSIGAYGNGTSYGVVGVGAIGVLGQGTSWGGFFYGDVNVQGSLYASTKYFKIDHPLDPANKYLYHASVESSEMMNLYTGNTVLDGSGEAWVMLPDYFEALNRDFRYQLTAIGSPGPNLYIAQEIAHNRFRIAGGTPGAKVSWQVTGIRQDAFAKAHPMIVEAEKPEGERGKYLHPVENGQPESLGINAGRTAANRKIVLPPAIERPQTKPQ